MEKQFLVSIILAINAICVLAQQDQTATPQWRPLYHFTPEKNWTNDPNGLILINGTYHLYNQQNPFENKWGHMSWGHATSTDLVHWQHLGIAMPETIDKDTTWRFSGCAVLDKDNSSGFCKTKNCLVAIYTAHQLNLKKESQYIAYSNDDGKTFTNYEGNPVIDLQKQDFRDPNVFWYENTKQWTMVVSLPAEHKLRFYGSPDLKNWKLLSEFGPQGYTKANWECPFLVQLPVDNHPGEKKWVLVNSAAGRERGTFMQYFVGNFDGITFSNDNSPGTELTVDYGDCFYAAIPWNNTPGNKRIYIGWLTPGDHETYPWKGQMSIPRDLSLRQTAEGIRLVQQPSALIKNHLSQISHSNMVEMKNVQLSGKELNISKKGFADSNAYWLQAELNVGTGATAGFKIAQAKDGNNTILEETEIGYDAAKSQLYVDRSKSGNKNIRDDKLHQTIDLKSSPGKIKLQILVDKSSLEVFVNDGEQVLTTYIFPGTSADGFTAFAKGGDAVIKDIKIWDLSKINQ